MWTTWKYSVCVCLKRMPISQGLVTVAHLWSYTCSAIVANSAPCTGHRYHSPHRALISLGCAPVLCWVLMSNTSSIDIVTPNGECSIWCFTSVSWCFNSGSRCFICFTVFYIIYKCVMMFEDCFTMVNIVLWCLVSCAMIGISPYATTNHCRDWQWRSRDCQ